MQPQALGNTPPSLIVLPGQESLFPLSFLPALCSTLFQFPPPDSYRVWTLQTAEEGIDLTRQRQVGI